MSDNLVYKVMFDTEKADSLAVRLQEEFAVPISNGCVVECAPLSENILSIEIFRGLAQISKQAAMAFTAMALARFIVIDYFPVLVRQQIAKSKLKMSPKDKDRVAELVALNELFVLKTAPKTINDKMVAFGISKVTSKINEVLAEEKELYSVEGIINFRLSHLLNDADMKIALALEDLEEERHTWDVLNITRNHILTLKPLRDELHLFIDEDETVLLFDKDINEVDISGVNVLDTVGLDEFDQTVDILLGALVSFVPKKMVIHNPYNIAIDDDVTYKMTLEVFKGIVVECDHCDDNCEISILL